MGWAQLANGELLAAAESHFDALVTMDKNLRYQQNLAGLKIAIVVLPFASWPKLRAMAARIVAVIDGLQAGEHLELPALA